ncbi:MAG: hypothetical protein ACRDJU_04380 [Actinomycetota bacterium]
MKPFSGEALLIDGQLLSPLLPLELRELPAPPRGAPEAEKRTYEAKFNQRARWRLTRHAGPDGDGATRWRCPFCSGLLRSRAFPKTMRTSRAAPLVDVEAECCCHGILTAMPEELPWWQSIAFGTTAWRISMGRRQVVESANSALKGAFTNLSRGFFQVMGIVKQTVLLASRSLPTTSTESAALRPSMGSMRTAWSLSGRTSGVPAGGAAPGPRSSRLDRPRRPRRDPELHSEQADPR